MIKGLRYILFTTIFIALFDFGYSQKVGLVFSGGGASGVSHIGVLKALEENNIPIDYITGTSMGALIGGLYAAGYSPLEIEQLFLSKQFREWAEGEIDEKYEYYLREKDENPALITFKIEVDTLFETTLPTNLISPTSVDYGLMKFLAPSSALAKSNFDNLFVPYRCVASDIISKKSVILKWGSLATAVRASMAYPFYLSPISYKGKLLFDGGLYNNFPFDVLDDEFAPEFVIGSNVSSNFDPPDEDNIVSQVKAIIADDTDYSIPIEKGIMIEPEASDFALFDFSKNAELIEIGYKATMQKMPELLKRIERRTMVSDLKSKRAWYKSKLPRLVFDDVKIEGLTLHQNEYVRKSMRFKGDSISALDLESEYIKISSDDKIKSIYPSASFNSETQKFTLNLKAKKEKDLFVSFGGVFSSRPH